MRPLEKEFTVIQWDRRGAGKTFTRNIPSIESINVRQLLNDSYTLIDTLRNRYNKDKIILVGHSFGTYLGSIMVTEHPELFSTVVVLKHVMVALRGTLRHRKNSLYDFSQPGYL